MKERADVDVPSGSDSIRCKQREDEDELSIAQLKQHAVVVYGKGRKGPPALARASSPVATMNLCIVSEETSKLTPDIASGPAQQLQQQQVTTRVVTKLVIKWSCGVYIPIQEASRCLCGHQYNENPFAASDPRVKNKSPFKAYACTSAKYACKKFIYVVAEGAWILRCRCKHKHIDHDPSGELFKCSKPKCSCSGFDRAIKPGRRTPKFREARGSAFVEMLWLGFFFTKAEVMIPHEDDEDWLECVALDFLITLCFVSACVNVSWEIQNPWASAFYEARARGTGAVSVGARQSPTIEMSGSGTRTPGNSWGAQIVGAGILKQ